MPKNSSQPKRPDHDLTTSPARRPGTRTKRSSGKAGARLRLSKRVLAAYGYLGLLLVFWFVQHFIAEKHWLTASLTYLPQHLLLAPLAVLYFAALRQKSRPALLVNTVSLLLIILVFLGFNIPFSGLAGFAARGSAAGGRTPVRVLSYDCGLTTANHSAIAAIIRKHKPDLVCLQDAPASGDTKAAHLLMEQLPNWYSSRNGQLLILSPHIITSARMFHVAGKTATGALKTMVDIDGQDVAVYTVHFARPTSGTGMPFAQPAAMQKRAAQLHLLLSQAEAETAPTIIAGNFNTPPRGLIYRSLRERFTDAFRHSGWGLGATWPRGKATARIDYVWTSSQLQSRGFKVLDEKASDHHPVLADLWLLPGK